MVYQITQYSYDKAKQLGLNIKPSSNPKKKIDVYKGNDKIASIGATGYKDYPTYLQIDEKLAKERRRNYKVRHQSDRTKAWSPGWLADRILW